MVEKLRRGAVLHKIVQTRECQKALNQDIASLKKQLEVLSKQYQPLISDLQRKADILARKFRKLYEESQEEYKAGEGELAKSLSIEGREAQDECQRLNGRANSMRHELKDLQEHIARTASEFNENENYIKELKTVLKTMRRPSISGFEQSNIQPLNLEQFLDKLPQIALREIGGIEFIPERSLGIDMGEKLGDTSWDPETKKATIRVYLHYSEDGEDEHETITHETGHEVFLKLLVSEEKAVWEDLYKGSGDWFVSRRAVRSAEEDFCECFAVFFSERHSELVRRDPRKYNFIKNIVKRLEKDYEKT